ncbi:MAG: HAD hydrolase-like protein, partial [Nanoarchaeota archaeon]|nr:HAD hydrolase-like protein [Nanoarchaeota archaeon]
MAAAIIFDFDGVILDSFHDQFKWFRHICSVLHKDFPYSSLNGFRQDYREPVYPDMYTFLGFDWMDEKETIWREYNCHKANADIRLFDGINSIIKRLYSKGHTLAIASSNTHDTIYKHLNEHWLAIFNRQVILADNYIEVFSHGMLIKMLIYCV